MNSTIQKTSSSTYSFIEIEKLTWASIQCGNKTGEKVAKAEENKLSQSVKTSDFCNPLQNRQAISMANVTERLTTLKRDACFLYPHVHTLVFLLVRSLYKIRGMLTLHPLLPLRQQWDPVKSTTEQQPRVSTTLMPHLMFSTLRCASGLESSVNSSSHSH